MFQKVIESKRNRGRDFAKYSNRNLNNLIPGDTADMKNLIPVGYFLLHNFYLSIKGIFYSLPMLLVFFNAELV